MEYLEIHFGGLKLKVTEFALYRLRLTMPLRGWKTLTSLHLDKYLQGVQPHATPESQALYACMWNAMDSMSGLRNLRVSIATNFLSSLDAAKAGYAEAWLLPMGRFRYWSAEDFAFGIGPPALAPLTAFHAEAGYTFEIGDCYRFYLLEESGSRCTLGPDKLDGYCS